MHFTCIYQINMCTAQTHTICFQQLYDCADTCSTTPDTIPLLYCGNVGNNSASKNFWGGLTHGEHSMQHGMEHCIVSLSIQLANRLLSRFIKHSLQPNL